MYLIYNPNASETIDQIVNQQLMTINVAKIPFIDSTLSLGENLTRTAIDISLTVTDDQTFITLPTPMPTLVVFEPIDLEKITVELIKSVRLDTVYFNSIDYHIDKHWMLGSTQAMLKILKSADKILNLNVVKNRSIEITKRSGKHFQLAWFAHRIGLKVYEP